MNQTNKKLDLTAAQVNFLKNILDWEIEDASLRNEPKDKLMAERIRSKLL